MKILSACLFSLFAALSALGQGRYEGNFRGDVPVGLHRAVSGSDTIWAVEYSTSGWITSVRVDTQTWRFPPQMKGTDWVEIRQGVWLAAGETPRTYVTALPPGAKAVVHYAGYVEGGNGFDNSFRRNRPVKFRLRDTVKGFGLGVWNIRPGEAGVIRIAPEMAYGFRRVGNIPPYSTLIYVVYRLK